MENDKFENFLERKTDAIYDAAHMLACTIAAEDSTVTGEEIEWDMQYIGEIVDAAEAILAEANIRHCYPYYEGDAGTPCYRGHDCDQKDCPFKSGDQDFAQQ